MPSEITSALGPYNVDTQLVAAVQCNAGARCHQSANLLHCYHLWAGVYQRAMDGKDDGEAREALEMVQDVETKLRQFLHQCRSSGAGCKCPQAAKSGGVRCGER